MKIQSDIDLDFADRKLILKLILHTSASQKNNKEIQKHNSGVYVTDIPYDPINECAAIDYKTAEERGYFKIDFLNVSIYQGVRDREHLQQLMSKEPKWDLLEQDEFVDQLFHLNGHGKLLRKTRPNSVVRLAAVLSMIRPSKRHLQNEDWPTIMEEIWKKPKDGSYYYKKSHSISYAMAVIIHMNLLCEQII